MYCKCTNPKKTKSSAAGTDFYVCSKNLGGCGEEIGTDIRFKGTKLEGMNPVRGRINLDGTMSVDSLCEDCGGEGKVMYRYCVGIHLEGTKTCETCSGEGYITKDI